MEFTFDFILIRNKFCDKFVIKNITIRLIYHISQLLTHTRFFQSACNPSDNLGKDKASVFGNIAKKRIHIQSIHKRMVRFICIYKYKPHHSFVYTLYVYIKGET
jgi:hypothetical protein